MIWMLSSAILIIPILLFIFILALPLRLEVRIALRCKFIKINLVFHVLEMIPLNLELLIAFEPHRGVVVRIRKRKELEIVHTLGEAKNDQQNGIRDELIKALVKAISVEELELFGELGFKDNAAASVFAAGGFQILLENVFKSLLPNVLNYKEKSRIIVAIYPNLSGNSFSLNLEGIFRINLGKLLTKAIAYKKCGGNKYASD